MFAENIHVDAHKYSSMTEMLTIEKGYRLKVEEITNTRNILPKSSFLIPNWNITNLKRKLGTICFSKIATNGILLF